MKKSIIAAAVAAMSVASSGLLQAAEVSLGSDGFQQYAVDDGIAAMNATNALIASPTQFGVWSENAEDESVIALDEGTKYLKLETDSTVLTNEISCASALSYALTNDTKDIYVKSTITFVPADDKESSLKEGDMDNDVGDTGDLKFALYTVDDGSPTNKLAIYHAYYDEDSPSGIICTNDIFEVEGIDFTEPVEVTATMRSTGNVLSRKGNGLFFKISLAQGSSVVDIVRPTGCTDEEIEESGEYSDGGPWLLTVVQQDEEATNYALSMLNFQGTGAVRSLEVGFIDDSPNTYTVDWVVDSVSISNVTVVAGTTAAEIEALAPANPDKDGYQFTGWTPAYADVSVNQIYTAQFVAEYTVTWTTNDAVYATQVFTNGTAAAEVAAAVVDPADYEDASSNYTFSAWAPAYAIVSSDITYTAVFNATAKAPAIPAWVVDGYDDDVTAALQEKYETWAANHAAGQTLDAEGADFSQQYLLNVDATATVALSIESIAVDDEGTHIVIAATANGVSTTLDGINGVLNVSVGNSLLELTKKAIPLDNRSFDANGKVIVTILATDGKFVKASVDYTAAATEIAPLP